MQSGEWQYGIPKQINECQINLKRAKLPRGELTAIMKFMFQFRCTKKIENGGLQMSNSSEL